MPLWNTRLLDLVDTCSVDGFATASDAILAMADLLDTAPIQLAPFITPRASRDRLARLLEADAAVCAALELVGPHTELAPNDALSLGLALHELATNASKYGALSCENGCVDIRWELMSEGLARIEWQERGGPSVPEQRKRGFGTDLIEKIVAHELRNPVELIFDPEGVRCTLMVPVRERGDFEIRASRQLPTSH